MARARNIKPGFFENEELVELSFATRLLFIGLWTIADREGRLEDKPKRIKMAVFPADDINVDAALDELQKSGFLLRYEVEGARFIQVLAFSKHQHPHKDEKGSTIPAPCKPGAPIVQVPESHDGNPADSPIADCFNPLTDSLNPDSQIEDSSRNPVPTGASPAAPKKPRAPKAEPPTAATWAAYRDAYVDRYGIEPVRNASVNSQLAQFVTRIGVDDSPSVAAFYVGHSKGYYVSTSHPVGAMLKDCEGLRTQWATGRKVMARDAQEADRIAADGNMWGRVSANLGA